MSEHNSDPLEAIAAGLDPDQIEALEGLKRELEALRDAIANLEGKSPDEVEGRIRAFQEKTSEVQRFLKKIGVPT